MQRRLLINYRVDPAHAQRLLPDGLRPQLVREWAVGGVCLLRLGRVRPDSLPGSWGLGSENVAHRIAVQWDAADGPATGVYIHRRDSASLINVAVGGRLVPGPHGRARFDVAETATSVAIACASTDGAVIVDVAGDIVADWPHSKLFAGLSEASEFFRRGSDGYSPSRRGGLDGLRLCTDQWAARPVKISHVRSSLFDGGSMLPRGAAAFDCALLMTDVPARWEPLPRLVTATA